MRTICLTLAYDGTDYVGWQIQPNGVSVQSVVTKALQKLTGETISLLVAGRTDSGVHAIGQVASFHTASQLTLSAFSSGLHYFLPDDIAVQKVQEVPSDFHATYSAQKKLYRYVIHNSRIRHPFLRRYTWQIKRPLSVTAMHEAAQYFLGTHDFRCFESRFPNKATSVRTVLQTTVTQHSDCPMWTGRTDDFANEKSANEKTTDESRGDFIWFDIIANGFLYNMVRAMMGTLVNVGRGYWTPDDIPRIIQAQQRSEAGETAPPQGLYLMHVDYGDALMNVDDE